MERDPVRVSDTTAITNLAAIGQLDLLERVVGHVLIPEDALHIAIAVTQGADYLLTWNFKHINNAETKNAITRVVELLGYVCPILCSPEELGGASND